MIEIKKLLQSQLDTVNRTVDFFTAEATNPTKFDEIKTICTKWSNHFKRPNGEIFIKLGNLSTTDFMMYLNEKKLMNKGLKMKIVDFTLKLLCDKLIITQMESFAGVQSEPRYKATGEYSKYLYDNDLILNVIFGFNFIIEKYQNSVFKIEHIDKNDTYSIGTGFLMGGDNEIDIVVTNKHVIEDFKKINLFDKNDVKISHEKLVAHPNTDLGLIFIKSQNEKSKFILSENIEVMSEIITIGYPSIPMTKYAYQIYHKGEINSFVEDYQSNKLFLFSAKTSSGNSGSPVIDSTGMVLGIVTEELFEKDMFYEKGKLPYYAAIPAGEIDKMIKEN